MVKRPLLLKILQEEKHPKSVTTKHNGNLQKH
jgi:hypothetical protein